MFGSMNVMQRMSSLWRPWAKYLGVVWCSLSSSSSRRELLYRTRARNQPPTMMLSLAKQILDTYIYNGGRNRCALHRHKNRISSSYPDHNPQGRMTLVTIVCESECNSGMVSLLRMCTCPLTPGCYEYCSLPIPLHHKNSSAHASTPHC